MKNYKSSILLLSFCLMVILMSTCAAGPFPKYLNGDCDIIQIQQNTYIKKSSVDVKQYSPPEYTIAIQVVSIDLDGNVRSNSIEKFFYEYDNRRMYYRNAGEWIYIQPNSSEAVNSEMRSIGEMTFYLAYGIRFYNCLDDELYNR